jgi:hypothetical protein
MFRGIADKFDMFELEKKRTLCRGPRLEGLFGNKTLNYGRNNPPKQVANFCKLVI